LLAISSPILAMQRGRGRVQKAQIGVLYVIGTFCIVVSIVRAVSVYDRDSAQAVRSIWASVQVVVSAFVANAPSIYGGAVLFLRGGGGGGAVTEETPSVSDTGGRDALVDSNGHELGVGAKGADSPDVREYRSEKDSEWSEKTGEVNGQGVGGTAQGLGSKATVV